MLQGALPKKQQLSFIWKTLDAMQNLRIRIQCALLPTFLTIIITVYLYYGHKTSVMKTVHQSQIASLYPFSSPHLFSCSNHNSFCLKTIKCFRATISSLSVPLPSHKVSILTSEHHHQCPGSSFSEVSWYPVDTVDDERLIMELQNHKIINDTSHPLLIRTASERQILLLLLWMETLSSFLVLWFCLHKLNSVILSSLVWFI